MTEQTRRLIFGADQTEGIVSLTLKDEKCFIYTEALDGTIGTEVLEYSPFVLSPVKLKPRSERLKGEQYFKYITSTTCEKFIQAQESYHKNIWLPRNLEECVTLELGLTYFKNRKVADISILSFDIETSGLTFHADSKVFLISNTFRRRGEITRKLFSIDEYDSQDAMIQAWVAWVREVNPSIMCGHNILSYDLPYLQHCSSKPLNLGRDGSALEFATKISKFRKDASQQYDYHNAKITGREIVDTFFLSIKYDIGREFPSYGLKPIIKYLGLEKEGRQYYDARHIAKNWADPVERAKIKQYAIEDSDDSLKLYDRMAPAYFYMANSIPKTFQAIINEASGAMLDTLMIRSYLQDGHSQPKTSLKEPYEGAISMGIPGVYDWACKADVASLYPSIMLNYDIYDRVKDPNRHMLYMLEYFREERLKNKELGAKTGEQYYKDLDQSQKILINSLYGFLGCGYLLYNYPEGAAQVTKYGREILLKGVEWATGHTLERTVREIINQGTDEEEIRYQWVLGPKVCDGRGYQLVNVDTDSFTLVNGPKCKSDFKQMLTQLNSIYPKLIEWGDDGIFEKVIVIRAKNYVLVKSDEYLKPGESKIKYKGSAVTDQKKELALVEMLEKMIQALLADKRYDLVNIYEKYIHEAANITDINRWVVKKTVSKPILAGGEVGARAHERKPWEAIQESIRRGVRDAIQEGDKLYFYAAIDGEVQEVKKGEPVFYKNGTPKMIENRILRDPALWTGDHDQKHYIKRVYETLEILNNVLDMSQFTDYTLKKNLVLISA